MTVATIKCVMKTMHFDGVVARRHRKEKTTRNGNKDMAVRHQRIHGSILATFSAQRRTGSSGEWCLKHPLMQPSSRSTDGWLVTNVPKFETQSADNLTSKCGTTFVEE